MGVVKCGQRNRYPRLARANASDALAPYMYSPGARREIAADRARTAVVPVRYFQLSVTVRPGRLIVPGGQYHVMMSTASRPARTAGSSSASCRDRSSEPVR